MTGEARIVVRLRVIGTAVEVRLVERGPGGSAGLAERVRRAWRRCLDESASSPPERTLEVVLGPPDGAPAAGPGGAGAPDLVDPEVERLLHRLSPLVTASAIEHQAGRLLMLHAAALAHPDTGATLGLVAPSGTGKTTVCTTLARRWGYVSDETLALRDDLGVVAYPKPLSVIGADPHLKQQHGADELGLAATPSAPHLAGLVLLCRDGSSTPWLEPVPTTTALARLAPETSYLARLERPLHRLAAAVEGAGGLRALHYAEAADVAGLLEELVAP